MKRFLPALMLGALCACATVPAIEPLPAAAVTAAGETQPVGSSAQDAADDPAIWRNPANPDASLIVATDKKAGLHVYGLDGQSRHFDPAGLLNNVDLADMGEAGVIVVASDRNDPARARLRVYRLDTASARLVPLGTIEGGSGEAYGICLLRRGAALHAFSVLKHGAIEEIAIEFRVDRAEGRPVRSLKLVTQTEGCVADPRDGALYVGEEDRGIWRFAAGQTAGELVAPVDGRQLVADVEGLALVSGGQAQGGFLIASSQGDNAFAVYRLPGMEPAGRFRIAAGAFGSVEETDGIELAEGDFGERFAGGLFVAQDGHNRPRAQNFKLVSWRDIRRALGL